MFGGVGGFSNGTDITLKMREKTVVFSVIDLGFLTFKLSHEKSRQACGSDNRIARRPL